MPKTNRRRTTHRKRTSQRKRKNAKRGVLHNMRGGFTYIKYVNITDTEKDIKNKLALLSFKKKYPTKKDVQNAYIEQLVVVEEDPYLSPDYISVYGNDESGNTGDDPINIIIRRNDSSDRTTGYGM